MKTTIAITELITKSTEITAITLTKKTITVTIRIIIITVVIIIT
jgi:hypothetical protein